MSRSVSSSGRPLTLTEELERLEQSITLTLQEIDHNFSKAHRIVTTSVLPLVEQYGEHSKNVWEASTFWKQFFEASANVSLSGYEELAGEGESTAQQDETTALDETPFDYDTTQSEDATGEESTSEHHHHHQHDDTQDSLLGEEEDITITGSTPRAAPLSSKSTKSFTASKQKQKGKQPQFAGFGSPYQDLRRELKSDAVFKEDQGVDSDSDDNDGLGEATAQLPTYHTTRLPDMSMTGRSSSFVLEEPTPKVKDPLLHRVLDKTYRLQATPLKNVALPHRAGRGRSPVKKRDETEEEPEEDRTRRALWADSPMSSPEMAVPKLRSDLYMSPLKAARGRGVGAGPRTPGVSVQTPATSKKRDIFADERAREEERGLDGDGKGKGKERDEITWESDEDEFEDSVFGGMSPPKTIHFALPPSKLLQTPGRCFHFSCLFRLSFSCFFPTLSLSVQPLSLVCEKRKQLTMMLKIAREASRRIVDDILITAGAEPEESEHSPTMVKMSHDILDDSF
ncbi:DASH complex subunit Ask1-domain-containing protein [Astrocystis sublimbata]|nr:DASH complex subunit Ask1-domain-containing protein [Astrocystis sublimbata]